MGDEIRLLEPFCVATREHWSMACERRTERSCAMRPGHRRRRVVGHRRGRGPPPLVDSGIPGPKRATVCGLPCGACGEESTRDATAGARGGRGHEQQGGGGDQRGSSRNRPAPCYLKQIEWPRGRATRSSFCRSCVAKHWAIVLPLIPGST
jgi:hypothetical protein